MKDRNISRYVLITREEMEYQSNMREIEFEADSIQELIDFVNSKEEGAVMTKSEYVKCEKLMINAICLGKQVNDEFKKADAYLKVAELHKWEIEQRKADQHYGQVIGVNQVLVSLGFKHEKMKELSRLL